MIGGMLSKIRRCIIDGIASISDVHISPAMYESGKYSTYVEPNHIQHTEYCIVCGSKVDWGNR